MKHNLRKFLSLLMVFAMLCGMVPAAMAASSYVYSGIKWDKRCTDGGKAHDYYLDEYYTDEDYEVFYCAESGCYAEGLCDHDWEYKYYKDGKHWVWCSNSDCPYHEEAWEYCDDYDCVCKGYYYGDYYLEIEQDDDLDGENWYYEDDSVKLYVDAYLWDDYEGEYVDADDVDCFFYFDWEGDVDENDDYYDEENTDGSSYAYLDTTLEECDVECTVYVCDEYGDLIDYDTVAWKLYCDDYVGGDIVVEATVDSATEGYWLDEKDDDGYDSVEDQIYDAIADIDKDYELEYVEFDTVIVSSKGYLDAKTTRDYYYYDSYDVTSSDYLLSDVAFYPEEDFVGEVSFDFTAYYYDDYNSRYDDYTDLKYISGTLVFNVINDQSTGMDILYTAESGEKVLLDEDNLEDFWYEAYPKGDLEYVKFTRVSDGYLYDNYEGGSKKWTDVEGSTKCYWDPTSKQIGLDDLTYVPGKNTVSATISFTAHGTTGSGSRTADVSGAITILYVDGDIAPIEYDVEDDDAITLDAADFTALYKDVMDVKNAGTLQIQFMEVPENGTLYMNYSVSKSGKVSGTKLTGSNIDGYLFSSSTSASRSIEDVSYLPDSDLYGDTITFACYSSNQLKFIGTINFNAAAPVEISLTCTAKGGLFKTTDFFNNTNTALKNANYILFGTPSSGTLYRNSTGDISTKVTVSDKFTTYTNAAYGYYSLNELAFMPAAIGLVEVPFVAVLSTGSYVNGTVKITVSPAVFSDVSAGAYYYDAVQWAVLNEVTTGTGDGSTFSPNMTCDRGQVVTFLWRSKGCPEPKTTANPFVDVKSTDYYSKAVLWAVEQGITTGTSGNTFSPSKTCTSGEVVTFLWRANGKPAATHVGTQFYAEAVAWATAKNLLSGTGTAFVATANCPRADIVTYMYRAEN